MTGTNECESVVVVVVVCVCVNVVAVETDACASELQGREWSGVGGTCRRGEVGVWWGKSERFYGGVVRAERIIR